MRRRWQTRTQGAQRATGKEVSVRRRTWAAAKDSRAAKLPLQLKMSLCPETVGLGVSSAAGGEGRGGKGWALLAADDRTGLYRRPPPVHRGTGGEAGPVSSD